MGLLRRSMATAGRRPDTPQRMSRTVTCYEITNVLRAQVMTECSLEANPCQLHTRHVALQGPLFVLHVSSELEDFIMRDKWRKKRMRRLKRKRRKMRARSK
ncbi:hypothetical protein ABFA07_010513 [Porites harrisoni]